MAHQNKLLNLNAYGTSGTVHIQDQQYSKNQSPDVLSPRGATLSTVMMQHRYDEKGSLLSDKALSQLSLQ